MLRARLAFVVYLVANLGFVLLGLVYTFAPQPMPYHLRVLGRSWAEVDPASQALLLALLHGAGLATLVASLCLLLVLYFPFRQQKKWALLAVPGLGLTTSLALLGIMLRLQHDSGVATPWPVLLPAIGLWVLGGLLSRLHRGVGIRS